MTKVVDSGIGKAVSPSGEAGAPKIEISSAMLDEGEEIFEDWLSEQDYGYESVGGRDLILRVLLRVATHIQKDGPVRR